MNLMKQFMGTAVLACMVLACVPAMAKDSPATLKLKARTHALREDVISVTDKIYTSVGHTVSTVSMIEGDKALIIIDTGFAPDHARKIMAEFRKISDKPVGAIILTHSHADHVRGASVFLAEGQDVQVWGRSNFNSENSRLDAVLKAGNIRGARQGGFTLPPEKRINNGIAPAMYPFGKPGEKMQKGAFLMPDQVTPNHTFDKDRIAIALFGVKMELVAAPGETSDALYVWLPEQKVLFAGDNFYASFPNLYAIRGSGYRDVRLWAHSVDQMGKEGATYLVPGHTRPVFGKQKVAQTLEDYRDAIEFVYDKTIEGMNKGMTPRQLIEYVKLPPELAQKDYLGEYYGNVAWSVRSIFAGHLGWFDGNAVHLAPMTLKEEATRMAAFAGGPVQLLKKAETALTQGDAKWAARLADYLLDLDPEDTRAMAIKADALDTIAETVLSATGRNYIFTSAQELRQKAHGPAK